VSNSQQPDLMKAIMKFLSAHMGKTIQVLPEEEFDPMLDRERFVEVGAWDAANRISMFDYVKGFEA
jgi:hypothetical protein